MENESELEQRIRERAFQIWIEEGKPEGRHVEHWTRAERQIIREGQSGEGQDMNPTEKIGEVKLAAVRTIEQGGS